MANARQALIDWLLSHSSRALDERGFAEAFPAELRRAGLPISRFATSVLNMHPEVFVVTVRWSAAKGPLVVEVPHSVTQTPDFINSPVEALYAKRVSLVRVRTQPGVAPEYPQLIELQQNGMTDYVAMPLHFSGGRLSFVSYGTDEAGGFADAQISELQALAPALSLRLEALSSRYGATSLLRVYLGEKAAERVLSGQFQRGSGEEIEAAIAFFDMRGFSSFSDRAPMRQVVQTLDAYFEALAAPIEQAGGEILKFIGDAVLAVFPTSGGAASACAAAVRAAREAITAVDALGERLGKEGGPRVRAGVGVHVGRMLYGNIGARQRLDFTVIGPAVNEASRIESLCKELGQSVLVSRDCAAYLGGEGLRSVGSHVLRGIREPKELFIPA